MPAFSVANQDGNIVTNEMLVGKKTVIYLYPKDSTPGCTAEACDLRDNYHAFLAQGYQIYGVSKDSAASSTRHGGVDIQIFRGSEVQILRSSEA